MKSAPRILEIAKSACFGKFGATDTTCHVPPVGQATPLFQTRRAFLSDRAGEMAAIDFFTVPTAAFRVLYVLLVLEHDCRLTT
jgi:hypothetical protein